MNDAYFPDEIINEIQHYQPEGFSDGSLFEFLYSLNDFDRQRAKIECENRIKNERFMSVKDFDNLWKAFCREQKQQKKQETTSYKQPISLIDGTILDPVGKEALKVGFEGIQDILDGNQPNYGKYFCSDSKGVFFISGSGEKEFVVNVCSHPLFPSKRYVDIETGFESLDISYKLDGYWRVAHLIDRETISKGNTITQLSRYGMNITSENAKKVVDYLADMDSLNRPIIPRINTVSRLGWIDGNRFSPYIDGIQYNNSGKFADMFSSIHTQGSFLKWKETVSPIMQSKEYLPARLVLAASVASVLLGWLGKQPFVVHINAPETGTGKTVTIMMGASVWGDPSEGAFMRSLNSTTVGIEQMDSFCNNLPLILDELQASNVDTEKFIYQHGEGTGKARGAKDGGLREQTRWKNIAITSGEQPLTFSANTKGGAINRVINIQTHGAIIPGNMGEFADSLRNNYGHAGKAIIETIISKPDLKDKVIEYYHDCVKKLNGQGITGKQANYGATLLVGDLMLNMFIFDIREEQRLLTDDIVPYLATHEMVDYLLQIRRWLCGFVASETQHFIKPDSTPSDVANFKTAIYGEIRGDTGSVLFIYEKLRGFLAEKRCEIPAFMSWCNDRGLIVTNHSKSCRHWDVNRKITYLSDSVSVAEFKKEFFNLDNAPRPVNIDDDPFA